MAISNCLFSPTSENPRGFSVWCILAKLSAKTRNYSLPRPLNEPLQKSNFKFKNKITNKSALGIAVDSPQRGTSEDL